jgi:hypothetical protein
MGEVRNACNILVEKPEGMRPHRRLCVDENLILEWILGGGGGGIVWIGFIWLRIDTIGETL